MRYQFTYEGKRYSVTGKTQAELVARVEKKKNELALGSPSNMTMRTWVDKWLETYKEPFISKEAYRCYTYLMHGLCLNMRLKDIRPNDLQALINARSDKSKGYNSLAIILLKECFEQAVEERLMQYNPARKLQFNGTDRKLREALTTEEQQFVVKVATESEYGMYPLLMLCCGLRPSEAGRVLGKDFNGTTLYVRGTKTASAKRTVPVPTILADKLKLLAKDELAVKSIMGLPTTLSSRQSLWQRFMIELNEKAGCEYYKPRWSSKPVFIEPKYTFEPYVLRHTYATNLQTAGVPINVAKDLLGHSDIHVTSKIYTHLSNESFDNASKSLEKFYQDKFGDE